MEPHTFTPLIELKKIWLNIWLAVYCIFALPLTAAVIIIPDIEGQIFFGIILAVFTVFMVLLRKWIPAFFGSLVYSIDDDSVKMNCGVFWKKRVTVPFRKITNVDISQGPLERMYNMGTIDVQTAGAGGAPGAQAELRFSGIRDLDDLKERIMDGMRGHIAAPSVISAGDETSDDKSELSLLSDILTEIKAVRSALEKK